MLCINQLRVFDKQIIGGTCITNINIFCIKLHTSHIVIFQMCNLMAISILITMQLLKIHHPLCSVR